MIDEQLAHQGMQDYYDELAKIHQEEVKVLDNLKNIITNDFYDDVMDYLDFCDCTSQYEITNEIPNDKCKQKEDYDNIPFAWVDQYCNGGYVGDDFAGWVWIKLNDEQFFKFHYSM